MKTCSIIQARGLLALLFLPAILASPLQNEARGSSCNANNCLRAVQGNPVIASPLCFSTLGRISTATSVVTAYSTTTEYVTSVSTETIYATTVTEVVLPPQDLPGRLAKRTQPASYTVSSIIKACSTDAAKISSACSCLLGTTTSTTTATTTTTLPVTETKTVSTTLTTEIPTLTVTSTCYPQSTAAITNGGFESGSLDPWYLVPLASDSTAGTYGIIADSATPDQSHAFQASLQSPYYLESGKSYTKVLIAQNLNTCPGATYTLSFWYKFGYTGHNFGPASYFVTFIDGAEVLNFNNGPMVWTLATKTFTATSTSTVLRFDLVNGYTIFLGTEFLSLDGVTVVPA
ncbi:hypothetical protein H072_1888 [Dactylellina haptotyla CBS 200.50]|uniref:CBM-cenC domain-containing protein n=1 Tax=Dactylellina haptotyla (strain CBS 200.50) TaxID=1284197 RepID=S8BXA9_DACHA|nr:hypothetical protein H072_1888 [Dactylellina haptotyla CBS 200.50]